MKKKSVLPFAAVLAIAAVWTMLNHSGPQPFRVNMTPFQSSGSTQTTVSVKASLADETREHKISTLMHETEALASTMKLQLLDCEGSTCTVEVSRLGDPALFQKTVASLTQDHPWLGTLEMQTKTESPEVFTLIFRDGDL
jgi:hypothetical protein